MTVTRRLGVFGLSQEDVASRLSDLVAAETPHLTLTVNKDEVTVLVSVDADSADLAAASLDACVATVRDRLGVFIYGEDTPDLQHRVVSLLLKENKKIATAESCTAGLLSATLTEVSGVSAVFECGVTSYANEIKHSVLGVPQNLLDTHGAVSEQVATAMAIGVRRLSGADFGIGITGVAGPEPSEDKPVGTVFVALSDEKRVWVKPIELKNADREQIRQFAVKTALDMARRYLEALPGVMAGALSLEKPSSETLPFPTGRVKKLHFWSPLFPSKSQGKAAAFRAAALWFLITAVLAVVVFSLYYFIYRPFHNEQIYDRLESVFEAAVSDTAAAVDTSLYPDGMLSRFYALYDQNADIRGWLKVDNTSVSYPVMDSRHSDYYATHDFLREPSDYGVPYFDSAADFSSAKAVDAARSFTIYGGNRKGDLQMFSPLLHYTDKAFFAAHEYLTLNTLYAEHRYRVAAVFTVDNTDQFVDLSYADPPADTKAYAAFLKKIAARSLYTPPFSLSENSRLLFLSVDAATEDFPARRLVVVAEQLIPGAAEPAYLIEENPMLALSADNTATVIPTTTAKISATANASATTTTTRPLPPVPPVIAPTSFVTTTITQKPTTKPTVPVTTTTTQKSTTKPTVPVTTTTTEPSAFSTMTPSTVPTTPVSVFPEPEE